MYHRVASPHRDPWDIAVPPELFDEQIAHLRKHRSPMSMNELVERLRSETLPADAVAVTFDDGYRDNLLNAKPILASHGVPATVFIATDFVGKSAPFWWDELTGMILESDAPLRHVQACGSDEVTLDWQAAEQADHDLSWKGWDPPQSGRQRAFYEIWRRLQSATPDGRDLVLNSLRRHLKAAEDPLGFPMTAAELEEITAGDLLTLEAHTVTHRALTDLDRAESRREIRESGQQCRALTRRRVDGFAYPYGNFDPEVRNDVAAEAFSWACTTEAVFLDAAKPDLLALPRMAATNVPLQCFTEMLLG